VEVDVVSLAAEFPNDNPALHCGAIWVCLEVTGAAVAVREERPRLAPPEPVALEPEPAIAEPEPLIAEPEPVIAATPALSAPEPEVELVSDVPVPMPVPVPDPIEPPMTFAPAAALIEVAASANVDLDLDPERDIEVDAIPEARISCVVPVGQDHSIDEDEGEIVVEDLPPLDETASVEGVVVAESMVVPAATDDPYTILLSTLVDVALGAGSPYVASVLPALLFDGRLADGLPGDVVQALAEANIASGAGLSPTFVAQMNAWRAILLGTSDDFGACGAAMLDEWAADLVARLLGAPSRATALRRELRSRGVAAFGLVEAA
jgi:hypothetical protein